MIIDQKILDSLTAAAKASPRQRMNYDLRNSAEDGSQRMLNAIVPCYTDYHFMIIILW